MSAVVQISALAGVIVGAGASYVTTTLTERARWRRQQDVRWDERRLVAYADYARAIKDIAVVAHGLAAHRGLNSDATPLEPTAQNLATLDSGEAQRSGLLETVRLLTDTDTITATRHLDHCLWHLVALAKGQMPGGAEEWEAAFAEYRRARDEYHRCARKTLGIPGAAIPRDLTWPPRWKQPPAGGPPAA
ncbi:hypothetical protein [Streptacidiphilus sp. EB129]|uniref:hypothetical protein n=1 Tax=Streptacidiphilus sp. EB129 TaxID=3156262 RepID=UPI00351501AE